MPSETPMIGIGADVHAWSQDPNRPLWVGGLLWPGEPGLAGHSDGDVVAHAACDALLSAAGLGDLGSNFGAAAPEWVGAPGVALLSETVTRVQAAGFQIGNVAVVLVGPRPLLGVRREAAQDVMSAAIGATVRLSATTTDHLGFTGRGEGLAAMATAIVFPGRPSS